MSTDQITETDLSKVKNSYGNYDCRYGFPDDCLYTEDLAEIRWIKKNKVRYLRCFHGFKRRSRNRYTPIVRGVVVLKSQFAYKPKVAKIRQKRVLNTIYKIDPTTLGQALYIINKKAKENGDYYLTKDAVLAKARRLGWTSDDEVHYSLQENRAYIIRSHYDSQEEYELALEFADRDDRGRPYNGYESYRIYLYTKLGGFGFHTPVDESNVKPEDGFDLGAGFRSPREMMLMPFTIIRARRMADYFLSDAFPIQENKDKTGPCPNNSSAA